MIVDSEEHLSVDADADHDRVKSAMAGPLVMRRAWAMPSRDTLSVPPIRGFVDRYLLCSRVSLDPFARNSRAATHRNDLNPRTAAEHHLDVLEFLRLMRDRGVRPDLVIFDPPYSPRQLKECYGEVGVASTKPEMQRLSGWVNERAVIREILSPGGVVLTFGWNSSGMGRGFLQEEILLVCHGGGHHDTICVADRQSSAPELPWSGVASPASEGTSYHHE